MNKDVGSHLSRAEAVNENTDAGTPIRSDTTRVPLSLWWMVFVLTLLYMLATVDRHIIAMLVDPVKKDLGLSDVQMGIILGPAFAVFYALCGWPIGWLADRYPRRWVIFLGTIFWSVAATMAGFSQTFTTLLLSRICVGSGEASLTPTAYSLMGDAFPRRRLTTAMSTYQTGAAIGSACAFTIGGLIIGLTSQPSFSHVPFLSELRPWQLALIFTGMPPLFLGLLVFTFTEPPRGAPKAISFSATGQPGVQGILHFIGAERRLLSLMAIGLSLVVIIANSLTAWVPTYISRQFHMAPQDYGPALGLINLIAAPTMIVKGWIVDWLYGRGMKDAHLRFYTWILAASIPIAIGGFLVENITLFLLCYAVLQLLVVQFVVYVGATIRLVTPSHLRAQLMAVFMSIFTVIGSGLGPLLTAMVTEYVYGDSAKIGLSLLTVSAFTLPPAWLALRFAIRHIEPAILREGGE